MYRNILLVAVWWSVSAAAGAEQIVWQIGKPDHDYAEFACAGNYQAYATQFGPKPIVFEVGRSDPGRDWPFIQPGPIDGWAPAARTAAGPSVSTCPRAARACSRCGSSSSTCKPSHPPRYAVTVGGRTGSFQLQPGGGDASLTNPRAGKAAEAGADPAGRRSSRKAPTRSA